MQHAGRLLEQRMAAAGVDGDPAVVVAERRDIDLLRQPLQHEVALVLEIGRPAGTADLLVQRVQFLDVGVDGLDGLADALVGVAAQVLHGRGIGLHLSQHVLDGAEDGGAQRP